MKKHTTKRKLLSLLLAFAMVVPMFAQPIAFAVEGESSGDVTSNGSDAQLDYGSVLGSTAKFNGITVFLFSDPRNNISDQVIPAGNSLPSVVSIVDYYSNGTELWYKIDATPGYTWPADYADYHYVRSSALEIISAGSVGVMLNEKPVTDVVLPLYEKITLTAASTLIGTVEYQWQILSDGVWIDIYGEDEAEITVSLGMAAMLLDDARSVKLRAVSKSGSKSAVSDTITVTVDPDALVNQNSATVQSRSSASASSSGGVMPLDESVSEPVTVTVKFVYGANGEPVDADRIYTVQLDSTLNDTFTLPIIEGYSAYLGDDTETIHTAYTIDQVISEDTVITFKYWPAKVSYTVIYYWQNVDNDEYTEHERVVLTDFTGNMTTVEDKTYEGFYQLLYEKVPIASDGSTVIEVYYDRVYYKMTFDLDGGYGVQPIYARYGTEVDVPNPTRAGYSFVGWDDAASSDNIADTLPATIPAYNSAYKAIWEANTNAKLTIVYWGENANDEAYSYDHSQEVFVTPGMEVSFGNDQMICVLEEHTHTADCETICGDEEHTHNEADDCYGNCIGSTHTHSVDCYTVTYGYNNTNLNLTAVTDAATLTTLNNSNPWDNGVVRTGNGGNRRYYIQLDGTWYRLTRNNGNNPNIDDDTNVNVEDCGQEEHTHTDACLSCTQTVHAHNADCYACIQHTHTDDCYLRVDNMDEDLWTYVRSDTVTVEADGSTVMNVYYDRTEFTITFRDNDATVYTIQEKWGADLSEHWPIVGTNGTTYNSGERWNPSGSSIYDEVLVYISVMPAESFRLTCNRSDYDTYVMHYMVEVLPRETGTEYNDRYFKEAFQVAANYNYVTRAEDFFDLEGYTQFGSSPEFSGGQINMNGGGDVYFYYTRKDFVLEFNNGEGIVKTESVPYESALGSYDFTPEPPSFYEPGSVEFGGWYLNPECTGEAYVLSAHTMPASNVLLYAKWTAVKHTVRFYTEQSLVGTDVIYGNPYEVPHGSKIQDPYTPPNDPAKGQYTFVGWFYVDAQGKEQMWDFENTTVTSDVDIYAKWSSNTLMPYEVRFVYVDEQDNEIEIADSIIGSALGGNSKTFEAKGNEQLYEAYREGYFATVQSHTITIDLEDVTKNSYTFYYIKQDAVPYTVKYLDAATGAELAPTKEVNDNKKAIVTETYVQIDGYLPNTYQQTLVIDPDGTNEIIFHYTKDDKNGMFVVHYWTENLDGTYSEHSFFEGRGEKGSTVTADIKDIENFTYDAGHTGELLSGQISIESVLQLNVYYTRNVYNYKVQYLEQGTNNVLADPKLVEGIKWEQIVTAMAVEIDGYNVVGDNEKSIQIRKDTDDPTVNLITFYYAPATTSLTISKTGESIDADQTFIFHVSGNGVDLDVTIQGNGSVTIAGLEVGETYTVTEKTDWSWRYEPTGGDTQSKTLTANKAENVLTFTNTRDEKQWLDGNAFADNLFNK